MKLLQRLAQALAGPKADSAREQHAAATAQGGPRRRRRGGRGRGRGGNGNGAAPVATVTSTAPQPAPRAPRREERDGGRRDGERPRFRWQRPPAHLLEQPLPEDVAFRPVAEGGDSSIVPARRRRPSRAGERVLAAGSVPYVARLHAEGALPPPDRTTDERTDRPVPSEPPALAAAAGEEGERKRRRRGRRGGRGRRRPGAEGAPPQDGGHDAVA